MASMIDRIEIWDKAKYEAEVNNGQDFSSLAEEVMGNIPNQED
jgi:DNA-binding transcriptional regulator/RsmH inhibitor MraZ